MARQYYVISGSRRSYGLFHFLFDVFMLCITQGLWAIWIIIRILTRL
jgi:hypothetical protein